MVLWNLDEELLNNASSNTVYLVKCILCCCFEENIFSFPFPGHVSFSDQETPELAVSILSELSPDHYRGFMEPLQHCKDCKVKYQLQPEPFDLNIAK